MKILKWTTEKRYIDVDTGELINSKKIDLYITINKKKITKYEDRYCAITKQYWRSGRITYTIECRKKPRQLELF